MGVAFIQTKTMDTQNLSEQELLELKEETREGASSRTMTGLAILFIFLLVIAGLIWFFYTLFS